MFHLEPLIWSLRGSKNFKKFGDDFTFVCTITKTGLQSCRITAACSKIREDDLTKYARMLLKELNRMGFLYVDWERPKDIE